MTEREKIIQQQKQLKTLFSVWMKEKMNHRDGYLSKNDGNIVEHYPDGLEKIVAYAK